jgi:hypothetical protein
VYLHLGPAAFTRGTVSGGRRILGEADVAYAPCGL